MTVLQIDNLETENSMGSAPMIVSVEHIIIMKGNTLATPLKPYSFSVFRIKLYPPVFLIRKAGGKLNNNVDNSYSPAFKVSSSSLAASSDEPGFCPVINNPSFFI